MTHPSQPTSVSPLEIDALVIGAGPVGLFQAFQLGLLGIQAHVVDALPYAGGQCMELYPDKPIYDIPALPACTGRELTQRLLQQLRPFAPQFHLHQQVSSLQRQGDGRFALSTDRDQRFIAKTVFIAAGVGAFVPQRLRLQGIEAYEGKQLFYHVHDTTCHSGKNLVIVGGGDSALLWARHYAQEADTHVTLVHRRDAFQAEPEQITVIRNLCSQERMKFKVGQITGYQQADDILSSVELSLPNGSTELIPLQHLLVFQGISPKLGPLADWNLALEKKLLTVDTANFSTSEAGIFAVGDINTYAGKKKLILCGFHEATLAAYAAAAHIFPEQRILLQYTTTSSQLHERLGVQSTG